MPREEEQARRQPQRLRDMLEAAQQARRFLDGASAEELRADPLRWSAVCYQLLILGEAANAVSTDFQQHHSHLPWRQMRGLRNFVAHQYDGVDAEIIHSVLTHDLPTLIPELQRLLEDT